MEDRLSVERSWFSNTLLLGFDAAQNEKKYRVAFSHDMFKNPNVKGMEVVLHFLLSQLYPTRINELLKFVWPINDQNQGKQYRQIIANLLQELKDKLDLPPIVSTLQSCSGKRFYDLLWKLSQHALQIAMQKNFPDYIMPSFPAEDSNTSLQKLQDVATAIKRHIARQSRMFVSHAQRAVTAQENWRQFDHAMNEEYNALSEELVVLKKEQAELATNVDLSRVNDAEAQETRKKRIDDVRKMWQIAEDFNAQVTNNKEPYADILSGNAYPHQLNASDLHIDKIPEELAGIAAPLLLPTTNDSQAPQFTLEGLITIFNSALSFLSFSLPPPSPPLPICTEAPRLSEWSKTQTLQLAAVEAFKAELTRDVVAWRKELQEAVDVRTSIDSALHTSTDDERFRMQPLPPPASYNDDRPMIEKKEMTIKELGFASPASRAPKQDVLEKLANSVKRVALRGSRTCAAINDELLPPDFAFEDTHNSSMSIMSTINSDSFFATPMTPAHTLQPQPSTSKRKVPSTTQRQSIMNAPLYPNKPQPTPSTTSRHPTKPKPFPQKPHPSSTKPPTILSTPYATSNDGSALNLSSIFSAHQKQPALSTRLKPRATSTKPTFPSSSSSTTTTTTSTSPPNPSAAKKLTQKRGTTTKPRPSVMDLYVNDLAAYIGSSETDEAEEEKKIENEKTSKPKPSGFRTGTASHAKTPKKKLAWAEIPDDYLHSHTHTLDAIEGTAFQTTKQLPRTPLPHEKTQKHTTPKEMNAHVQDTSSPLNFFEDTNNNSKRTQKHTTPKETNFTQVQDANSPLNFFEDNTSNSKKTQKHTTPKGTTSPLSFFEDNTSNSNSLFSDDVEWNQFINTSHNNSPKPNKTNNTNINNFHNSNNKPHTSPFTNNSTKSIPSSTNESMDYDIGNVDSPMHMTDWLSSAPSPSRHLPPLSSLPDETNLTSLFPTFSSEFSFSNDHPKQDRTFKSPKKNTNHSIFATPADEPYEYR